MITDSYEGLEGTTVTVYSGDLDITASDDGVNAANSDIGERSDLFAIQIRAAICIFARARTVWTPTMIST